MKLVKDPSSARPMLFDLNADIGETTDILSANSEIANQLASKWNAWN